MMRSDEVIPQNQAQEVAQEADPYYQQQLAVELPQGVAREVHQKPFVPNLPPTRFRSINIHHMGDNEEDILGLGQKDKQHVLTQILAQTVAQEDLSTCFVGFQTSHEEPIILMIPHTHSIHQEDSAQGEPPRRRPKSKPPFETFPRSHSELNKESFLFPYEDTFPYFHLEPGDTLDQKEALPHESWCTLQHENLHSHYLPFLEPKKINQQRLYYEDYYYVLKTYSVHLDVPRLHLFQPKLSRLKDYQLALFGQIL